MANPALSQPDPQVKVSTAQSEAIAGAHRDAPNPRAPASERQPPPSPTAAQSRTGSPSGRTHGLYSKEAVIGAESAADLDAYRAEMEAALAPVDRPERDQVEVIVMSHWKLRRLWRQETTMYGWWERALKVRDPNGARGFNQDHRTMQAFTRLSRIEGHLTRAYLRAESRLRLLQDLRRKGLRGMDEEGALAAGAGNQATSGATDRARAGGLPEAPSTPGSAPLHNNPSRGNDSAIGEITDCPPPSGQAEVVASGREFPSPSRQLGMEKEGPASTERLREAPKGAGEDEAARSAGTNAPNPQTLPQAAD